MSQMSEGRSIEAPVVDWVEEALASCTARDCTVIVQESHEVNLRWAANALTTNGAMTTRQATVISHADVEGGVSAASVSGPLTSAEDLVDLVRQADVAAPYAPADDEAQPLVAGDGDNPNDDDFSESAYRVGPEDFATLATDLGRAFERAEQSGHLLFGFAEYRRTTTWLANSAGLRRRAVEPMGRLELNAKMPDLVNSAWVGAQTGDFIDVDVAAMHDELERRLGWGMRRVDLPAGSYETILPAGAVVDLLFYAYLTMSARDAEQGRNVYAGHERGQTRIGERLSDLPLTLASDPADERLPVAPFAVVPSSQPGLMSVFDNGAPVGRVEWLREGSLSALVRTRAGMQRAGLEGGMPFPSENLIIDADGKASVDDLIASTKRGLLLTCLWYIREVDPQTLLLTGLTRDGVYLIEDGQVVAAVNNFRFNESPIDLLRRATEAGVAEHVLCREWNDWFTRSIAPALRIPDFTMSTVSQAY
ncbi:MAG: metallopeptidase TldD-related protein [Ornithinimicrobium sp.]|uniref:metallopeptidase TldD-related protein n=1 Tax=Ornithinimicrobium sp. TaxID=1977084 RepID=UPI003D9B65E9